MNRRRCQEAVAPGALRKEFLPHGWRSSTIVQGTFPIVFRRPTEVRFPPPVPGSFASGFDSLLRAALAVPGCEDGFGHEPALLPVEWVWSGNRPRRLQMPPTFWKARRPQ